MRSHTSVFSIYLHTSDSSGWSEASCSIGALQSPFCLQWRADGEAQFSFMTVWPHSLRKGRTSSALIPFDACISHWSILNCQQVWSPVVWGEAVFVGKLTSVSNGKGEPCLTDVSRCPRSVFCISWPCWTVLCVCVCGVVGVCIKASEWCRIWVCITLLGWMRLGVCVFVSWLPARQYLWRRLKCNVYVNWRVCVCTPRDWCDESFLCAF